MLKTSEHAASHMEEYFLVLLYVTFLCAQSFLDDVIVKFSLSLASPNFAVFRVVENGLTPSREMVHVFIRSWVIFLVVSLHHEHVHSGTIDAEGTCLCDRIDL